VGAYLALPVGTSIALNAAKRRGPRADLLERAAARDPTAEREVGRLVLDRRFVGEVAAFVCGDPRALSAELNTILGLKERLGPGTALEVDLFRTESPLTALSAEVVKECVSARREWGVGTCRARWSRWPRTAALSWLTDPS
jgi:CRISPR/Cas system-associated protein Csm6